MLRPILSIFSVWCGVLLAGQAFAQPTSGPPLTFVGAGIGIGPRDIDNRVAYPTTSENFMGESIGEAGRLLTWHIDGAVRIARRAALGAEFMVLEPARGLLRGGGYEITEIQEERVLTALPRFRAKDSPRAAFDLVGGPGLLFWNRTDQAEFAGTRPDEMSEESGIDWAWTLGADGVFAVARHVGLTVGARLLWLNRARLSEFNDAQEPSTRILVTVGVRFGQ